MASAGMADDDPPELLPVSVDFGRPGSPAIEKNEVVGITLIAGFLGSGKSTLVRRILTEPHGMRILVVENEFGDRVSSSIESVVVTQQIDGKKSDGSSLSELIELPNGCVCCAASSDLTSSLGRLMRRPGPRKFDHIVIEASGLADPGPVAASFWVDEDLEMMLRLDSIVTVVDSSRMPKYLSVDKPAGDLGKARLAEKQVAVADAIVLNKLDIASPSEAEGARDAIKRLKNPNALIFDSVRCEIVLEKVLRMQAYSPSRIAQLLPLEVFSGKAVHPGGVGTLSLVFRNVNFDRDLLDRALGSLLWNNEEEPVNAREIWRVKALVLCSGQAVLYQAVDTLFEGATIDYEWPDEEVKESKFVFIGRELDEADLKHTLDSAIVAAEAAAVRDP